MAMTQRARILWVIALVITPLVLLTGALLWDQLREEQRRTAAEREQLARAAAFAAQAYLEGQVATARAVASHPLIVQAKGGPTLDTLLATLAPRYPEWEGIGVIGADGYSVAGSLSGPPIYFGDRPYFRSAVASGQPVVSAALIGRRSGKTTVIIAVPLDKGGVMIAALPTDRFGASLKEKLGVSSGRLTVVDHEGQAFIRPDPTEIATLERLGGPDIDAVLAGKHGTRISGAPGQETLVAYAPVERYGWGVLLSEPVASAFDPARRDAIERAAVVAVILAVVVGLGWILAGRVALYAERTERLSEDLRRALETRDEFLAAAAHDLRNPLSTIQAAGEVIERATRRPGSVAREHLGRCSEHILSSARRMARLLNAFLDVAHLQVGRPLELDTGPSDFAALVRQVVLEWQHTTGRHRIVFDGPESLGVEIDGGRLQRAVENLVGNAIKYSPDGGEISVRLQARGAEVLLAVEDHGIGIPPEDRERVFQRFERGANVAGRFAGTGIGLAAARQIVEQHGGSITLESEVGKGTTFTMHFPALRRVEAEWQSS